MLENYIKIPFLFIRNNNEFKELQSGIIMAYCWCSRFGAKDGLYHNTLNEISNEMGLHYNKVKDRHHPKRIKQFKDGLQYLIDNKYIILKSGNLNDYDSKLVLQVDYSQPIERYTLLNFKYFDYILSITQRIDKNNLLLVLVWVLSWYEKMEINSQEMIVSVCSYSITKMAKLLNMGEVSISRYLNLISGTSEENYPLVKEPSICFLYQGQYVAVPNIYVENTPYANQIISKRGNYYKRKIAQDNSALPNNFEEVDDDLI